MMMYNNKLAIAVKSNGKVLREFGDTVYVPFGTEYTLLIKNLNSVRVQVRVSIDGTNATEGVSLIVQPNSEMELERFIKAGNMNKGNRFKFIERTAGVEAHRGIGVTDGLIRIEYEFEKPYVAPVVTTSYFPLIPPRHEWWEKEERWVKKGGPYMSDLLWNSVNTTTGLSGDNVTATYSSTASDGPRTKGVLRGMSANASASFSAEPQSMYLAQNAASPTMDSYSPKAVENEAGITVAGSVSDQKFHVAGWFPVESTTHVMVIKLLGETESGKPVVKPVTVKAKAKCTSCGRNNKASAKFCANCGTSLEIV
jgi:zinc-ribbon domain